MEQRIAQLTEDIAREQANLTTPGITDEETEALKASVQSKVTQYKTLLNDQGALFEEMYSNALVMINRDKQIIKNEEEIVQLKHEIDINILEIE